LSISCRARTIHSAQIERKLIPVNDFARAIAEALAASSRRAKQLKGAATDIRSGRSGLADRPSRPRRERQGERWRGDAPAEAKP